MLLSLSCKNSNFLCHFHGHSKPFFRGIVSLEQLRPKKLVLRKTQYRIIYDFPYVRLVAPILKSRKWIPAVGVATAPILYYLDPTKVSPFISIVSAGCYFLFGMALSKISTNLVGKMYINKEGDIKDVMISSVNDCGKRIDRIHNIHDIINTDFPTTSARYLGFVKLVVQNSDEYYLLNIINCEFIDVEACNCILGANWGFYNMNIKQPGTEVKDKAKQLKPGVGHHCCIFFLSNDYYNSKRKKIT